MVVSISGNKDIDRITLKLKLMRKNINSPKPAWEKVGQKFRREFGKQFDSNGAYLGQRWAPLSPNTVRKFNKNRSQLLVDTGGLRRSWTRKGAQFQNVSRVYRRSAVFGSRYKVRNNAGDVANVAVLHDAPRTTNYGSHIPARRVGIITKSMREDAADIILSYVFEPFDKGL